MYIEAKLTNECFNLLFDLWPWSKSLTFTTNIWICFERHSALLWRTFTSLHTCRSYALDTGFALTPKCDLYLLTVDLSFVCDTALHHGEHLYQIILLSFKEWARYRPDKSGRTHGRTYPKLYARSRVYVELTAFVLDENHLKNTFSAYNNFTKNFKTNKLEVTYFTTLTQTIKY
jgi:hypothetical protein